MDTIPKNITEGPNKGHLGYAKPPLQQCTSDRRATDAASGYPTIDVSTLDQDGGGMQWSGPPFSKGLYGFTQKRIDDFNAEMKMVNGKGTFLRIKVENSQAKAYTELHGRKVRLVYQYVHTAKKLVGDLPEWFLLIGEDVLTGKRIIEFRNKRDQRMRAGWTKKYKGDKSEFYTAAEIAAFEKRFKDDSYPAEGEEDKFEQWYVPTEKADSKKASEESTEEPEEQTGCCGGFWNYINIF